jgi:hypothetical protein
MKYMGRGFAVCCFREIVGVKVGMLAPPFSDWGIG